jgi:hypothetical protein
MSEFNHFLANVLMSALFIGLTVLIATILACPIIDAIDGTVVRMQKRRRPAPNPRSPDGLPRVLPRDPF